MFLRWITALFGIPAVLIIAWLGGLDWVWLLCIIGAIGLYEWSNWLTLKPLERTLLILASLLPLTIIKESYLTLSMIFWFVMLLLYVVFQSRKGSKEELERLSSILPWLISGVLYIPFLLSVGSLLRYAENGFYWILFSLLINWSNDTAAFFIGSKFRGPKMAPSISPNKTWSGGIGGLIGAGITGGILTFWSPYNILLSLPLAVAIALCLAVAGQAGDLFESFWKRSCGIKDSGNIIPGHGGVLDRFDSLLVVWPVLYLILISLGLLE